MQKCDKRWNLVMGSFCWWAHNTQCTILSTSSVEGPIPPPTAPAPVQLFHLRWFPFHGQSPSCLPLSYLELPVFDQWPSSEPGLWIISHFITFLPDTSLVHLNGDGFSLTLAKNSAFIHGLYWCSPLQGNTLCHPKRSLWHVDYFEVKTSKAPMTQEEHSTFSLTA